MKDSLKYGIMGVIAIALIVNGYILWSKSDDVSSTKSKISKVKDEVSKDVKTKTLDASGIDGKAKPLIDAAPVGPLTSLVFEEMEFDYGDIKQDSENEHIFKFTNTGSEPLIISKAKGSCGCTVPKYPDYPIAPGESDIIQVVYKPGKQKDKQTKTVTITANTEPTTTVLRIMANVSPVEG